MNSRQKLEAFYSATMQNDRAAAEALMHPDFTVYEPDGLPYAGIYKGKAAWWELFPTICRTWSNPTFEPGNLIGDPEGNELGWVVHLSGRSALTGRPFTTRLFEHWLLKDGLLWEARPHYWDTKLLADCNTPCELDTARQLLDSFASLDVTAVLSLLDDNITIHAPYSPPDIPAPKSFTGKAEVAKVLGAMLGAFERLRLHDIDLHATDDPELIVGTGRSEAVMRNGQPYANYYVYQFRIRNGKVYEYYEFFDSHIASQGFSFAR